MVTALVPASSGLVQALAGDIVLWPFARQLTLAVPIHTQEYKWVPKNCGGVTRDGPSIPSRGSKNTRCRVMLKKLGLDRAAMSQSAPRFHFCQHSVICTVHP